MDVDREGGDKLTASAPRNPFKGRLLARDRRPADEASARADKPAQERAEYYRRRAGEIRGLLARMKDPQARALTEQTIANYEQLASIVANAGDRAH